MRVLVVAEWYPSAADPVHGIWAHRQALAARDAGADVRVLALRRPVPPLAVARQGPRAVARWLPGAVRALRPAELDGLHIRPVPFMAPPRPWSYARWGAWIAPALTRVLARERPFDLVHARNVLPTGEAVLRQRRRPRFVVSTHGPDIIHVARSNRRAAAATARTLRGSAGVIANSGWAAARCRELAGGDGALPVSVVHFGADLPGTPGAPGVSAVPGSQGAESGADAMPARHERPTVITVAHLQARKRHELVMRALARMPTAERPDYVIVGDGEMRRPLQNLCDRLGLRRWVRFLGALDHPAALAETWRAHVCAMPSVEEPFGVAYVEAMAGGLPAIGCRGQGGPEDIAAAGEGMVLVAADDEAALTAAIERCLRERERLGAAARATVQRAFTWERCGQQTVAAYEAALR